MKRAARALVVGALMFAAAGGATYSAEAAAPAAADAPAVAVSPAGQAPTSQRLVPHIYYNDSVKPASATKCTANADTCMYVVGSGLTVSSWTSKAYQFPEDGVQCNIVATFRYNVTIANPGVWDVATFPGCETAPPNGYILWTSPNVGPVTFSGRTYVNVSWTNGFGTTPNAEIHS